MDTTKTSDRSLPRRTSAKKAQQSFAEQLDSDDSDGGTTGQQSSTTRRPRVPVKKKGAKASRTMANSESTEDGELEGIKSKGKGRATSPLLEAVSTPGLPPPTSGAAGSSSRPRPRPRPVVKKTSPPLQPLTIVTEPQRQEDELSGSPLTSLASFSEEASPVLERLKPPSKTFPFPLAEHEPPISFVRTKSTVAGPSKASTWSLSRLGNYGWVLVDKRTFAVYDPAESTASKCEEKLWWPAKFDKPDLGNGLSVSLFGKGRGNQLLSNPSQESVLSYHNDQFLPRFSMPTFVVPHSSIIDLTSPRKKAKLDQSALEKKWEDAVLELKKDKLGTSATAKPSISKPLDFDDDDKDGNDSDDSDASLPEINKMLYNIYEAAQHNTTLSRTEPSKTKGKGKRKRKDSSGMGAHNGTGGVNGGGHDYEAVWEPPEPDLEVGELGLCREKASPTLPYWPAKVIEYLPPAHRKQPPKYRVAWLDETVGVVERSWFYRQHDDGFATCRVGEFDSLYSEVQNDADDEDTPPRHTRSPSPLIENPSPSGTDFAELSIRLQFQYTKEVLRAILANEYIPTRQRHALFIKGGRSRNQVVENSTSRGKIDPKEVDSLLDFIKGWCLRDGARVVVGRDLGAGASSAEVAGSLVEETIPRVDSPIVVDSIPSSPPEPPPSSLPPSRLEREDSVLSDISNPGPADTVSVVTEPLSVLDDALNHLPDTVAPDAESTRDQIRVCQDFESLSGLHKEDYCLNILVPEAVRQILLWRTGQRSSISLLTPAEEQDLYERGEALMNERDWVRDVIRMREFQDRLRLGKQQRRPHDGRTLGHNRTHSGSRLRKNVVMPNYQE